MNFLHSGSLGDIVYSIPTIKQMTGKLKRANLYLKPGVPDGIPTWAGNRQSVRMNRDEAEKLLPLLQGQPGFNEVAVYDGQPTDIDLDAFRQTGFNLLAGDITRYYAYALKVSPKTYEPWLKVEPSPEYAGCVLVNRTNRYRNKRLDYSFLARPNVVSVGYPDESLPRIPHVTAPDALTLARWIAGCKLFVGNQSFCFALAEAMKAPRVLEVYLPAPNVRPCGPRGYEAIGQDLFEAWVKDLANLS